MKLGLLTMIYDRGQTPSLLCAEANEPIPKVTLEAAPPHDRKALFLVFAGTKTRGSSLTS